ncbi:MAG: amidohydrolase family protein [Lachnospiraceae bacterium]
MIIDFHTHTFPENIAASALKKLAETSGTMPHSDGTETALKKSMEKYGITYSVMLPVATKPQQVPVINGHAIEVNAQALSEGCGLLSFGAMHCAYEGYREELKRLKEAGVKGIKLHHDYMKLYFDDERSLRVIEEAFLNGLIVMLHAGDDPVSRDIHYCTPERISRSLNRLKGGALIASHFGGLMNVEEAKEFLAGKDIYIDTSMGHHYFGLETLREMLLLHNSDKILFGTDSPWENQGTGLALLRSMSLSEEMIEKITGENPRRVLGL